MREVCLALRSPVRRPVRKGAAELFQDAGGAIPDSWCFGCGTELFYPLRSLCPHCRRGRRKGEGR